MSMAKPAFTGLDRLVGRTQFDDTVVAFTGESQAGKTLFAVQDQYRYSHMLKKPFIYVDTEGGGHHSLVAIKQKCAEMYPDSSVITVRLEGLKTIGKFFGKNLKIGNTANDRVSEQAKEKMNPKMTLDILEDWMEEEDRCELYRLCSTFQDKDGNPVAVNGRVKRSIRGECAVSGILLDSVTDPLKFFSGAQQNFQARSAYVNYLYDALKYMACLYPKLYCATINHESQNPANPYDKPKMAGGTAVHYNSKIIVRITKYDGKKNVGVRKLILKRAYDLPPDVIHAHFRLTNDRGYVDMAESEVEK